MCSGFSGFSVLSEFSVCSGFSVCSESSVCSVLFEIPAFAVALCVCRVFLCQRYSLVFVVFSCVCSVLRILCIFRLLTHMRFRFGNPRCSSKGIS